MIKGWCLDVKITLCIFAQLNNLYNKEMSSCLDYSLDESVSVWKKIIKKPVSILKQKVFGKTSICASAALSTLAKFYM